MVELETLAGEPMDVLVNGYLIAQGEVVVVNDKFGIRLDRHRDAQRAHAPPEQGRLTHAWARLWIAAAAFVGIVALIPLALWLLKRTPIGGGAALGVMRTVAMLPISANQRLLTVEVGSGDERSWLVLGVSRRRHPHAAHDGAAERCPRQPQYTCLRATAGQAHAWRHAEQTRAPMRADRTTLFCTARSHASRKAWPCRCCRHFAARLSRSNNPSNLPPVDRPGCRRHQLLGADPDAADSSPR